MGCFNINGFLSNCPIQEDDEVVVFLCAGFKGINNSLYALNTINDIYPISLPIFGKYNSYGSLSTVYKTNSERYINKVYKHSSEFILSLLCNQSYDNISYKTLKTYNEDDAKKIIEFIDKLNYKPIFINDSDYLALYNKDNLFLTYIMEHKSIYETYANLNNYFDYKEDYYNIKEIFNNNYNKNYTVKNILSPNYDNAYLLHSCIDIIPSEKKSLLCNNIFTTCLTNYNNYNLMIYQDDSIIDFDSWEKDIFDFINFTLTMNLLGHYFSINSYCSTEINKYKSILNKINDEKMNIIKKL